MPDHRETNQTRFGAGRSIGQVKHQADKLSQRHSSAVYPTPQQLGMPTFPVGPLYVFTGIVFAIAILARFVGAKRRITAPTPQASPSSKYERAKSLLTPTEAHFYQTLRSTVGPMAVIQCKVRLADLLLAPRHDITAFRRVSQKHVDFVLCEQLTLRPLVAVELDDRSHDRPDRQRRDQFVDSAYQSAGLPIVHIPVEKEYNPARLLETITPYLHS